MSRIVGRLKALFASWEQRDLAGESYPILFLDGFHLKVRLVRERIEGEFAEILKDITPHPYVLYLTEAICLESWQERMAGRGGERERWEQERRLCEAEISRIAARAAKTESEILLAAYERRIAEIEKRMQLLAERVAKAETVEPDFGTALEKVLGFVASPYDVWHSEVLEDRQNLLSILFGAPATYDKERGFGTVNLAPGVAIFREITSVCFPNVRTTANNWSEYHFNRSGHLRKAAATPAATKDAYQKDIVRRVLEEHLVEFERWVIESYERPRGLNRKAA